MDFNRPRHRDAQQAMPLAARIFLDALNVVVIFFRQLARSA